MFKRSVLHINNEKKKDKSIVTLCKDLDEAICDGIELCKITEIVGSPGSGKTQLCLQLCVNVQIPEDLYGLNGAAIFIDTNRGFTVNRVEDMAKATHAHCTSIYKARNVAFDPTAFNVDTILNNIQYSFCDNYMELLATVNSLTELLREKPKIRLIVIDSFSYLFRTIDESIVNRVQMLHQLCNDLQDLAEAHKCAIVITNEITTRIAEEGESDLVSSLGESHAHRVNYRITLDRDQDSEVFVANVDKSFTKAETKVAFRITNDGVRPIKKRN